MVLTYTHICSIIDEEVWGACIGRLRGRVISFDPVPDLDNANVGNTITVF